MTAHEAARPVTVAAANRFETHRMASRLLENLDIDLEGSAP
jgi:hypothetical protein